MRVHGGGAAWRRRHTLVALGGVAAIAAAAPAATAGAAPAVTDEIVFAGNAPAAGHTGKGHYRINVMNTDGVGVTLNPNPAGAYDDMDPAWSPDGRRIAFASNRGGNFDVYDLNANGTGVTRLTSEPKADRYPAWSPNGTKLAFSGYGATGGKQIFTMAPNGSGMKVIAHTFGGDQPSWAPDSLRIAFTDSSVAANQVLDVVNSAAGAAPTQITSGPSAMDRYPAWSPDGSRIAFRRFDPTGHGREVWTVSPAGGTPINLSTALGAPARSASWSPDGRDLVFVSYRDADHNQEIWLGSLTGTPAPRQLTFTTWDNDEPRWANVPIAAAPVPPATGKPGGGGVAPGTGRLALSVSLRLRRQALGHRKTLRARVRCNQGCSVVISGSAK